MYFHSRLLSQLIFSSSHYLHIFQFQKNETHSMRKSLISSEKKQALHMSFSFNCSRLETKRKEADWCRSRLIEARNKVRLRHSKYLQYITNSLTTTTSGMVHFTPNTSSPKHLKCSHGFYLRVTENGVEGSRNENDIYSEWSS